MENEKKLTETKKNPFPTDDFYQQAMLKCFGNFEDPRIVINEVRPGKYRTTAIYDYDENTEIPFLSQVKLVWKDKEVPFQVFKDAYIQTKIGNFDTIDVFIAKGKKENVTEKQD